MHTEARAALGPPDQHPAPALLRGKDLHSVDVRVTGSHILFNDRNKEAVAFQITVALSAPTHVSPGLLAEWTIEKLYTDVVALDQQVRNRTSRPEAKGLPQLPDKALFRDNAPSKVDARKASLGVALKKPTTDSWFPQLGVQVYLQLLCRMGVRSANVVCDFLTTNRISTESRHTATPGRMQGFLTKKGRALGGWTTRFYVLAEQGLEYFDSVCRSLAYARKRPARKKPDRPISSKGRRRWPDSSRRGSNRLTTCSKHCR